ncbi:hypothetical protein B9Z19DRAFT_769163 [Tuber borchii]|uniref:Uncharacterized protein n=1 Tax=Tuber borchii TaxID=42251 RepID=A0A2T6ZX48_TUBBO|nr:hypothetical protein B9Z19DRAFT_769163 [Tuber borchii]
MITKDEPIFSPPCLAISHSPRLAFSATTVIRTKKNGKPAHQNPKEKKKESGANSLFFFLSFSHFSFKLLYDITNIAQAQPNPIQSIASIKSIVQYAPNGKISFVPRCGQVFNSHTTLSRSFFAFFAFFVSGSRVCVFSRYWMFSFLGNGCEGFGMEGAEGLEGFFVCVVERGASEGL